MCAVSRPRWDSHANHHFDGNTGVWTFILKEPAKRSSNNLTVGTMETKCITRINRVETTNIFVDKVIPSIKQRWPVGFKRCIIQKDNSKPQTTAEDNSILQDLQHDCIKTELPN